MADSLVNTALLRLEGMAFDTVKQQTEVGKRAQGLKDDLAWLQLRLRGADQRRRREINEYIELWVRQTREVAFDAENLLDEYLHEGQLHCRGVLDLPSLLRWLRHSATGLFVRQSIISDIDAIKARLKQIMEKTLDNNFQLQTGLPATATSDKRRKRYVDWDAPSGCKIHNLVGIDEKLNQIKDWLNNPREARKRTIVAIMGKSGVGKTTLASCVYESSEVRAMFQYIIWVHVPEKFRLVDVVADMERQSTFPGVVFDPALDPDKKDAHNISELTKRLSQILSGNKYLVVLDNVRNLDDLKLFLSVLPECKGSAMLITTKIKPQHIASTSSSTMNNTDTSWEVKKLWHHQVMLQKLGKEEAREMFCMRIFGKPSFDNNVKNGTYARTIEDLLENSVPLAGTLLAGLLRTKKEEEWADVINQLTQQRHKLEQQKQNQETLQKKQLQQLEEVQEVNQEPIGKEQERGMDNLAGRQEVSVQEKQLKDRKEFGQEDRLLEKQHMIDDEQEVNQLARQLEGMKQRRQADEAIECKQLEEEKAAEKQLQKHVYRQMSLLDQILMLSFDNLPPQLKQCFLYFSAFKAEEPITADKLIRLWVAEGLVQRTDGRTAEKHGRDHLRTLISRCLVNVVKKDYNNNIISVSIHERVIGFARTEAHDINFLQVHHNTSDLPSTGIRRLSVRNAFDPHTGLALATPKLRSLLCECPEAPCADLGNDFTRRLCKAWEYITGRVISLNIHQCKFLRVVDLQGMVQRTTLPGEIGWLIYLQYLGLARTGLKKLPRSIKNLHSLQTLDISSTSIKKVPKGLWKIKSLRHVLAEEIENGPSKTNALHNLQTLQTVQCKGPALEQLISLRSLRLWRIDQDIIHEKYLGRMECLKSLDLASKEGAQLPLFNVLTMFGLRTLQHLKLVGKVSKLEKMTEEQYLLHNLTKLELKKSELDEGHINLIAKVPNLADLILGEGSYIEKDMSIPADGFPELRELQINNLSELTQWTVAEGDGSALKKLERLSILNCRALTTIPDKLKKLEHLVFLAVQNSPKFEQFPSKDKFQSSKKLSIFKQ